MTRMKAIRIIFLLSLALLISTHTYAQELKKSDIVLTVGESVLPGRIVLKHIKNNSNSAVKILITNEYESPNSNIILQAKEERTLDRFLTGNRIQARVLNSESGWIDLYYKPKPKETDDESAVPEKGKPQKQAGKTAARQEEQPKVKEDKKEPTKKNRELSIEDVVLDFNKYIESIPFYSNSLIEEDTKKCETHITNLKNWTDTERYKKENRLNSYINENRDSISIYSRSQDSFISSYMERFSKDKIADKEKCIDSIRAILNDRTAQRERNVNSLSEVMNGSLAQDNSDRKSMSWKSVGTVIGLLLVLVIVAIWYKKANKKTKKANERLSDTSTSAANAIIVKKTTTTVLRKQSLDDVAGNDAYLRIDSREFCDNSAVRTIYIKNSCIKDIYNMYAEDLRNPNNPKEDGCMVLGRWIHDSNNNEYDVSLEQIVLPGDDAVFSEYELNFGGKIKLKVTEQLRKLRRDTNLQYDLTCWVHSHPGLGVFFSNSDTNVQMQLKHAIHPNFLTAIVVDILTPQQELGIFAFKKDSTISSKADLKKTYSLEELHKWAVESERNIFKAEDYYNTLAGAKSHLEDCSGIELSNGAIIDMSMFATEQGTGFTGFVHGYTSRQGTGTESVVIKVSKDKTVPDNELIGGFVIAIHCSIPSVRRLIANYLEKIRFVLVFTPADGLLTSIPVVNQDICMDENYYGEQKLEDLKIWTRRKR